MSGTRSRPAPVSATRSGAHHRDRGSRAHRGADRTSACISTRRELEDGGRELDLGREGGHSKRRMLHAKTIRDAKSSGRCSDRFSAHPNITVLENHLAVDFITTGKLGYVSRIAASASTCSMRQTGEVETLRSDLNVLATGGCGKVYLYTTNPDIATGDGVAMAYRAGAAIANMEFIQFHPTCLYHPEAKSFLISEAVRGEGGVADAKGEREFMDAYHPLKSLAPRDIVARAIDSEDETQRRASASFSTSRTSRRDSSSNAFRISTRPA